MQIKQVEQQETQLKGLLDAVPDSVYICSKATEERRPRSLFANQKLNTFFGSDVVKAG